MKLIDKQDNVLCSPYLVDDGLYPFFELAAVFRPGHHHRQVQHNDAFVFEDFRDVFVDYLLAEALDDGGLADPCFTQKNRIVLRTSAEYLNQPLNLSLSADYGVQLSSDCQLNKVSAEAV